MEPRGIRNNNPGNIRASDDDWQGKVGVDDAGFVIFDTPENGARALSKTLDTYSTKHGLNTVRGIIGRWAPESENDTAAYVDRVSKQIGVGPDDTLDLSGDTKQKLMAQIIAHENGISDAEAAPLTAAGLGAIQVTPTGPAAALPSVNPNDSEHWALPSELLQPNTPAIDRDPLYASGQRVAAIKGQEQDANLLGGQTGLDVQKATEEAYQTPAYMLPVKAFQTWNTNFNDTWNFVERTVKFAPSKDFQDNLSANFDEFSKRVPQPFWGSFAHIRSREEMESVIGEIHRDMDNQRILSYSGLSGTLSMMGAGLLEADAALALGSGGVYTAGKSVMLYRMGRAARMAGSAAVYSAALGAIDYQTNPTAEVGSFAMNMLGAAALPAGVGLLGRVERGLNHSIRSTLAEYGDAIDNGRVPRDYKADEQASNTISFPWPSMSTIADKLGTTVEKVREEVARLQAERKARGETAPKGNAGAARNPNRPQLEDEANIDDVTMDAIDAAREWRDDFDWRKRVADAGNNPRVAKFLEMVNKIPGVKTDWEKLVNSPSAILNKISFDLLESATGILVNNKSAAFLKDIYFSRIVSLANPYEDAVQMHMQKQGLSFMDRHWNTAGREQFDRLVQQELLRRRYNEPELEVSPEVKAAADHWQKAMDKAFNIAKGRDGETSIHGFDDIQHKAGYFPVYWKGDAVKRAVMRMGRKTLVREWGAMIRASHGSLTRLQSEAVAKAFISRALDRNIEADSSLISMLQGDGRAFLLKELQRRMPVEDAQKVVDTLGGKVEERGMNARAKGRLDVDLRQQFSDGTQLLDLIEGDMRFLMQTYAHSMSGAASLARKGLRSNADVTNLINQALEEQEGLGIREGNDKFVSREQLEHTFSYFGSGPVNKGLSPIVRMAKGITNLGLVNQLGLTQVSEVGTQIAAVGWKQWSQMAPIFLKEAFAKPGTPRAKHLFHEIEPLTGRIGDSHLIYRNDILLDEVRRDPGAAMQFMDAADKTINKLRHIQGYTNGFNMIQRAQHQMSMEIMLQKVAKVLTDRPVTGVQMSAARLADIGLEGKVLKDVQDAIKTHAEFDADGNVKTFNFDKWDYATAEDFAISMNRSTYRMVQRAMAGEESMWMTGDVGALFSHLKQFPILAMKKQFIREGRINDVGTKMMFLYGLGAAGAAYAAKQAINGNFEQLDPYSVALGAFSMSNMTGWVTMWTDPVAAMLGYDQGRFSQYGAHGVDSGIITTPAVLPTLNKMLHAPQAVFDAVTPFTEFSNSDISALKTIPIVGNAYGISTILNAMRD